MLSIAMECELIDSFNLESGTLPFDDKVHSYIMMKPLICTRRGDPLFPLLTLPLPWDEADLGVRMFRTVLSTAEGVVHVFWSILHIGVRVR